MEERKIYDAYVSFSHKDREAAGDLINALRDRGISVWYDDFLLPGTEWATAIAEAISAAKFFILLISESSIASRYVQNEIQYAIGEANNRSKEILLVGLGQYQMPLGMQMMLRTHPTLALDTGNSAEIQTVADKIGQIISSQKSENVLYDKLSKYMKSGAYSHAAGVLCDLIEYKCRESILPANARQRRDLLGELVLLLETLQDAYERSETGNELEERFREAAEQLDRVLEVAELKTYDLYYHAIVIRLLCYQRDLLCGDVMRPQYTARLSAHHAKYRTQMQEAENDGQIREKYPENEWKFIVKAPEYIQLAPVRVNATPKVQAAEGDNETLLRAVASFMQEGNKLFDIIGERDMAEDFLRCLVLSYERLKAYCEVVGEKEVCARCIDRIFELQAKLETAQTREGEETAQTGIKTLLGLTVPKSGKFDVFISHKKEDMDIASDMYYFMKKNMKEAFFDKYTLPEMSEAQYRKAIMQALDGSSHFVVIFSDLSYLESYWVNLEMEIFQSEIDEGRKPNSNFIMVVTNKVYDQIMASNKSVLPIQYRRTEIMRVEEYKKNLLRYIDK